ncbi:hypothetical protein V4S32_00725 [Enterococcus cecorum]
MGSNCIILDGVTIERGSVIGARNFNFEGCTSK